MIDTVIGKTYTVGELIEELKKFPEDMPVAGPDWWGIEKIEKRTWEHSNYPYNLPDTDFVVLDI